MIPKVSNYFDDKYGMLHADKDSVSENPILFTVIYNLLGGKIKIIRHIQGVNLVEAHFIGEWIQTPWSLEDPMSHDNMTAINVHLYKYYNEVAQDIGSVYKHPRDWIFYWILKGDLKGKLLAPIFSLMCIISCWRDGKVRPNIFKRWYLKALAAMDEIEIMEPVKEKHKIRTYYKHLIPNEDGSYPPLGIYHEEMIHTDGKILCWLRFQTGKFPKTQRICEKILRKKFGRDFWKEIFTIYFSPEHPIVKLF